MNLPGSRNLPPHGGAGIFKNDPSMPFKEGNMRLIRIALWYLVLFPTCFVGLVDAEPFVGIVKTLEGRAVIERNSQTLPVSKGMYIQRGDLLKTDAKGAVGLVFSDDTLISMGPNSAIMIDDYLFEPLEKKLSFIARILRGTISYISGQIAKLSPESVRVVVPDGTIGVRGTHVLIKVE